MKEFPDMAQCRDPVKKESGETFHDITKKAMISASRRIFETKGIHVAQDIIIAIINDIDTYRKQGKTFKEARSLSTRRWCGNQGKEYWSAVSSVIGILYASRKKEVPRHEEKPKDGKYKDFS